MITVSTISPWVSVATIDNVIERQDFGCTFLKYVYGRQEGIQEICQQCKDKCDVIYFSGEIGYHYVINHIHDLTTPCAFAFYNETHVPPLLLNFSIQHPNIPLNRVYVGFLTPGNQYMNLRRYLPTEQMPYCYDRVEHNYTRMLQQPKELYEQGKTDYILTRYTNNLNATRALGISYQHFLPTEEMISDAIHDAINQQKLSLGEEAYQIIILIKVTLPEGAMEHDKEYYNTILYRQLVGFRRYNEFDFSIESTLGRLKPHMRGTLERNKLHLSKDLVTYLIHNSAFHFWLGVGIGDSMDSARYSAEVALHGAVKFRKNDGFLVEDGKDPILTGPLSFPTTLSYSYSNYRVQSYPRQSGIDERNLLRIMGIFEMGPDSVITSSNLSSWPNITVRSCNQILPQLLDPGLTEEIDSAKEEGRSRSVRQYRFCTENC